MRRCARRSCPKSSSCPFSSRCSSRIGAPTETSTSSHPSLARSRGPGCCATSSRSTSRRARAAAARPAGSRRRPSRKPSPGCSRSTVSVRGHHRRGRRHEGSCGLRYLARDRGDARANGSSERARPGRSCVREGAKWRRARRSRGQRPPPGLVGAPLPLATTPRSRRRRGFRTTSTRLSWFKIPVRQAADVVPGFGELLRHVRAEEARPAGHHHAHERSLAPMPRRVRRFGEAREEAVLDEVKNVTCY